MKSKSVGFVAAVLGTIFFAQVSEAKLNVVATTPDLGSIAHEIGGDRITVAALAKPTEDPHFVDAKPSFIVKLNHADALIEGGAELEIGWLPPLLEGARNDKLASGAPGLISCAEGVQLLEVPSALDRSKGDVHAMGNPHFMTDPVNGKNAARLICEGFCRLDAKNCPYYRDNLTKFDQQIDAKMAEWEKLLAPYQGTEIVAYHNTWPYFARRFGLKIDLFLEPKPGIPPTPAHLAKVIDKIKSQHIRAIVVEPYQNRKTAETVAGDTGAAVLSWTQYPGGVKDTGDGYIPLLDYLVHSLAKALGTTGK